MIEWNIHKKQWKVFREYGKHEQISTKESYLHISLLVTIN